METGTAFDRLVEEFGCSVWERSPEQLAGWAPGFFGRCAEAGGDEARVVRAQPDETLALAIQKGVVTKLAFTVLLWERYRPRLPDWFRRIGRRYGIPLDADATDELIQELQFNCWVRKFRTYSGDRVFGSYLFVSAHNLFVQRRLRGHRGQDLAAAGTVRGADDVFREVTDRDLEDRFRRAVAELTGDERGVMEALLAGLVPKDVADKLGLDLQRVYKLRARAWNALDARFGLSGGKDRTPAGGGRSAAGCSSATRTNA